jgi:hypothetical protein
MQTMPMTPIRFTIRRRGGEFAGHEYTYRVAAFDWELFKNTPNAEAFTKKAYYAAAQKLVRDMVEEKPTTDEHHLVSMENLIARTLKFTKQEIIDWCESREWSLAKFTIDSEKGVKIMKDNLPNLSSAEFAFPQKLRARAAEIVAEVADKDSDPIANYLFVKLSQTQPELDL